MLNSSYYAQPHNYQQYNTSPYQKNNQQISNYYQMPPISTINWNFINECNPELIETMEDDEKMQKILNLTVNGDFQSDYQTNQNPSVLKLLNLIKVVFKYQVKCIDELNEKNQEVSQLYDKNKKSNHDYKKKLIKYVDIIRKSKKRERCPRCHHTFATSSRLDEHMKVSHPDLMKAWNFIRNGEPYQDNSQKEYIIKLEKKINKLEKKIDDLTKAKQTNNFYYNDDNNKNQNKRAQPNPFNNNKPFMISTVEEQPTQQQPQFQPQFQPQPQPQQTPQKSIPNEDEYNLAKLNAKKQAEDFLWHRRRTTPILPQQVDEIARKVADMVHEQSKQINYGVITKEEGPEEARKEMLEDVKSDHPMPKTSSINNLKDLKKPPKPVKVDKKKEEEEEEHPEEEIQPDTQDDNHHYGDSMPLTSSSLQNSFVFLSEQAEYESNAEASVPPKYNPKLKQNRENDNSSSYHSKSGSKKSQSKSKPKGKEEEEDKKDKEKENKSGDASSKIHDVPDLSSNSHSKFEMPSNDYDFAVYESAESVQDVGPVGGGAPSQPANTEFGEEEVYYSYVDEEDLNEVNPAQNDGNDYDYDAVSDNKGFIHASPQPKSIQNDENDDQYYDDEEF